MAPRLSIDIIEEYDRDRLIQSWGTDLDRPGTGRHGAWQDIIARTFLPEGYPGSVSSDYLGEEQLLEWSWSSL